VRVGLGAGAGARAGVGAEPRTLQEAGGKGQGAGGRGQGAGGRGRGRVASGAGVCGGHQQRSRLLRPPAEAVERVVGELRVEHPAREGDEEEGARGGAQQRGRIRAEELA
jgi:hypothetical protein